MTATRERNSVIESTQCPECARHGRDRHRDNLKIYSDDSSHCFACGYHTFSNGKMTKHFVPPQSIAIPLTGIKTRSITAQTCERYGVTRLVKTSDNGVVILDKEANPVGTSTLVFPFYSADTGELVTVKKRDMAEENKKYAIKWGDGDNAHASFFGLNVNSEAKTLIIAEGELDALTLAQLHPDCAVWGLPGVDWVKKAIRLAYPLLKKFKKIVVCMDNDEAGKKATEEMLPMLPAGKAHVVALPMEVNDPNEMLMNDDAIRLKQCIKDARQILPRGIVEDAFGHDSSLDSFFGDGAAMGITTGYPELDGLCGGLRPGKFFLVAGGTGSGKSTFVENIVFNVANLTGKKTFFIPLEMLHQEVSLRLIMQRFRLPFTDPNFDRNSMNRHEVKAAFEWVYEHVKFFDHYGGLSMNVLADTIDYAVDALGCEVIVLDHVTAAANTANGLDWKELEATASRLKQIAIQKGVCVLAVSHINRGGDAENKMPQLKDVKASSAFAQYADMVLGIARPRDSKQMTIGTLKCERSIGKFANFTLEFDRCKLVSTSTTPLEDQLDDKTTGNTDRSIPLEVRKPDSKQPSAASVRETDAVLDTAEAVHTGLLDSEEGTPVSTPKLDTTTEGDDVLGYDWRTKSYNSGGGERGFDFNGQNKITRGKEGLSQSRLTSFVPELFTNDKCERRVTELRTVGKSKRNKVGGRKRNTGDMVK